MSGTLIIGAVLLTALVAALAGVFRSTFNPADARWRALAAFLAGNLLLVLSHGVVPGLIGLCLMGTALVVLVVLARRRSAAEGA